MSNDTFKVVSAWAVLFLVVGYAASMTLDAFQNSKLGAGTKESQTKAFSRNALTSAHSTASFTSPKQNKNEESKTKELEVIADGLNLRSQPWKGNNVLASLKKGSVLEIVDKQDDWYRVKTSEGKAGYIVAEGRFVKEK